MTEELRVLFIHGGGYATDRDLTKQKFSVYLSSKFKNFHCEHMTNTSDGPRCIKEQIQAISKFKPDLIVTKSQGGSLILELIHKGFWNGPTVMCCPAIILGIDDFTLPENVPFIALFGEDDVAVPVVRSEVLKMKNEKIGDNLEVIIIKDNHSLRTVCDDNNEINLKYLVDRCWNKTKEIKGFDASLSLPKKVLEYVPEEKKEIVNVEKKEKTLFSSVSNHEEDDIQEFKTKMKPK